MPKKFFTLQNKLSLFFIGLAIFLTVSFATLVIFFGLTDTEIGRVQGYISNELDYISGNISADFTNAALDGINLASSIANSSNGFLEFNSISGAAFLNRPDLIEQYLESQIHFLTNLINSRACSGTFIILDMTANPDSPNAENSKAGLFLVKTQPLFTKMLGVWIHILRGPPKIAHQNDITLRGEWRLEYDFSDDDTFKNIMETARANSHLPLSRLYYWTHRISFKGYPEAEHLLTVPLIAKDGTVLGICGIAFSDIMYKSLYSPTITEFSSLFSVIAPVRDNMFCTSEGFMVGNYYTTDRYIAEDLEMSEGKYFASFSGAKENYGGKISEFRLYPTGSPSEDEKWAVAVMLPDIDLKEATKGNSLNLIAAVAVILIIAIIASIFLARFYMNPVNKAFDAIKNNSFEQKSAYLEINDLFEFLAEKDREHEEELRKLELKSQNIQNDFEEVQSKLSELAAKDKIEINDDSYQLFLKNLKTLTNKERQIFDMYISGLRAKDIIETSGITENTLKYHNRNIYGKLGVTSRKELLLFASRLGTKGGR